MSSLVNFKDEGHLTDTAIAIGALIFSALSALALPPAANASLVSSLGLTGLLGVVFSTLFGGVGLIAIIFIIKALFLRLWTLPILGLWLYKSSSGNYGSARLLLRNNRLEYRVDLYLSAKDLIAAYEGHSIRPCFSVAHSKGLTFQDGQLDIIYSIPTGKPDYPNREGLLILHKTANPKEMLGTWRSFVQSESRVNDVTEQRCGTLEFLRPRLFVQRFGENRSSQAS